MQCLKCGKSNNVEKASTIVERETHYSTVTRGVALGDGKYGTTQQGVTSQSERAQALTADEPIKESGCVGTLVVGSLLTIPTLGILMSCAGLAYMAEAESQRIQLMIVLLVSVLVFIALISISVIVSHKKTNSFTRQYNYWYNNIFDRRYYCGSCGNIMQF